MGGFPGFVLFSECEEMKVHTVPTAVHTLLVYQLDEPVVLWFSHIHVFLRFSFARSA